MTPRSVGKKACAGSDNALDRRFPASLRKSGKRSRTRLRGGYVKYNLILAYGFIYNSERRDGQGHLAEGRRDSNSVRVDEGQGKLATGSD